MSNAIRLAVVTALFVLGVQLRAQVDTNDTYSVVYGNLVKATSSELTVEAADASGTVAEQVFTINASTKIDGCTLSEVIPGTQLLVYVAERKAGRNVANYVKFYGCEPTWQFSGTIVSAESGSFTLEIPYADGTTSMVTLKTTSETIFATCYGVARAASDFTKGTGALVNAAGAKDNLRALYVSAQDDCGENRFVEGTFVSFIDTVLSVKLNDSPEVVKIVISDRFGVPYGDSAQYISTCTGEWVSASDIRGGEPLTVMYLSIPSLGNFLQYAQLQRDCPINVSGTITKVDGRTITITANGADFVATLTDASGIHDCTSREVSAADLVVGTSVDAAITPEGGNYSVLKIQIKNDCPYAFYIGGKVSATSQSSVTIDGFSSEDGTEAPRELSFDAASVVLDCMNQPLSADRLQIGSDVVAYYRTSGSQRFADLVIVQSPCDISMFAGMVLNASETSLTVSEADGTTRLYAIDVASKLTDCNGESITISPDLLGKSVSGSVLTSTSPATVQWASFNVGCPVIVNDGGIITMVSDSSLTIQGASGRVELQRSAYTAVYDAMYLPAEWSALRTGDSVCTWYDDGSKMLYRVVTGSACDVIGADGTKPMIGTVTNSSSSELTIKSDAGEMSFALTTNTSMMTTSNAPVSISDITVGTRVSVMSSNYNRRGQPVASSVMVMMSPTSVDDESNSSSLVISPNPASDFVTISNTQPGEMITLFDQRGNRVLRTDAPTFNVAALAPGIYSVVVENGTAVRLVVVR
ncbi:MAG: T9SS type A sorting domain-containing protein [Candidatus Kapaibacterium sp.]